MDDFSTEHLNNETMYLFEQIVNYLNISRDCYNSAVKEKDTEWTKDYWWQMIQLLPSSYNQTRNVMMNYEVLCNIYNSRKNHKLDEWVEFCKWIEALPYAELIIGSPSLKSVEVGEAVAAEFKPKMLFGEPFPWIKEEKEE